MKNKKFLLSLIALLLICIGVLSIYLFNVINRESLSIKYLSSDTSTISVYDEDLKDTYWNIAYILNVTTNDIITPKKYFKNNTSIELKDYIKAINKFGNKTK